MADLIIPAHIAIIMDGNGRWAKKRGLPRRLGHKAGCEALEFIVEDCARIGVKCLTVYAFSTENWRRSEEEISALMQLFRFYIPRIRKKAMANDIRVRFIGDPAPFDEDLTAGIRKLEEDTRTHQKMDFIIALNYGSRDEITKAARALAEQVRDGSLAPEDVTEEKLSGSLYTAGIPDPDLLIRTSGEKRISNYLLWQLAYTEFVFTDTLWPDFRKDSYRAALEEYASRDRRFGKVK